MVFDSTRVKLNYKNFIIDEEIQKYSFLSYHATTMEFVIPINNLNN